MITPEQVLDLLARGFPLDPDIELFGVEQVDDEGAIVTLDYHERLLRPGGTIGGPSILKLVDTAAYVAVMGVLGPVTNVVTSNLNVNFLRKPAAAGLSACATFIKVGKRSILCDVRVYSCSDEARKPIAHATVSYAVGL